MGLMRLKYRATVPLSLLIDESFMRILSGTGLPSSDFLIMGYLVKDWLVMDCLVIELLGNELFNVVTD